MSVWGHSVPILTGLRKHLSYLTNGYMTVGHKPKFFYLASWKQSVKAPGPLVFLPCRFHYCFKIHILLFCVLTTFFFSIGFFLSSSFRSLVLPYFEFLLLAIRSLCGNELVSMKVSLMIPKFDYSGAANYSLLFFVQWHLWHFQIIMYLGLVYPTL